MLFIDEILPIDTPEKKAERKALKILNSLLDSDVWVDQGSQTHDYGIDRIYEYVENNVFRGNIIYCQVKGRSKPDYRKNNDIYFDFPVKTANYAVRCSTPFIFFLVDLIKEAAFYLPVQDFFIQYLQSLQKLSRNKTTISLTVPCGNKVDSEDLRKVAKYIYKYNDTEGLKRLN